MSLSKRATGSYYTPSIISDFIINRIFKKHDGNKLEILEPSAGDGVFIRSLYRNKIEKRLRHTIAVELNKTEANKIGGLTSSKTLSVNNVDFLDYQQTLPKNKFDMIIGNPPYIKKNLLTPEQIELCQNIHSCFPQLSSNSIKNIWSAFLVRSISLLKNNGILAFVLPAELLQVNYTAELRKLLVDEFERIEIFTFNELLFKECKGQDTLVLIAEKNSSSPGLFFHNVVSITDLEAEQFYFVEKDASEATKWTTHCLTESEITLLNRLKSKLKTINQLCDSKAGIVTGANEYFILNESNIELCGLQKHSKPIVQKGAFVKSWIEFSEENYNDLIVEQKPCFLVDLNMTKINQSSKINKYLSYGISQEINTRYKTKQRERWYEVPNVGANPQAFFFKRCHDVPKFVSNKAKVLATDSAYLVNAKENIDIDSLVLSFYNSLTLIFSELNGRFYGGGVLELTPNEFRSLPLPYLKFSRKDYSHFIKLFNSNQDLTLILRELDKFILKKVIVGITDVEIKSLEVIRSKLLSRRKRLK